MLKKAKAPDALLPHLVDACGADFSPCETYRYALYRIWDTNKKMLVVIGLNPSTADEAVDDNTVAKCRKWARAWGYGGLVMLNAFGFRATDPKVMKRCSEPIGPRNDEVIRLQCQQAGLVLVAWGVDGGMQDRDKEILKLLREDCPGVPIKCLAITKDGYPQHPLYIKSNTIPVDYPGRP